MKLRTPLLLGAAALAPFVSTARASEADIHIPDLSQVSFFNGSLSGTNVLMIGLVVCVFGVVYGWFQYLETKKLKMGHKL